MPPRRFTDKPDLDPGSVRSLAPDHPAMVGNRSLFPSTVVEVTRDAPDRILVSGRNNRKLGDKVEKGRFEGYAIYGLSLEERATCPVDCDARGFCYGNGMQLARRHKIGDPDVFFDRLAIEIEFLLQEESAGLLIRLHVLGDFPSVEYVAFWADVLSEHPNVACYGYTHRLPKAWGGDEIGEAVKALKDAYPDRFRIRWSSPFPHPDGAVVIDRLPTRPRVEEGLVCPVMTEATACCATCTLCWEAPHETIVFVKHGPKSGEAAAERASAEIALVEPPTSRPDLRPIAAISLPAKYKPATIASSPPEMRMVAPAALLVEPTYQRDLSGRSVSLIRKIVTGWDWAKFKPPVCAEMGGHLFVIDGQHTAIAAASHPDVREIPVMVVSAALIEQRADAFVAHNRDRLAMSALQIFHAEIAAGGAEAKAILAATTKAGASIPRAAPMKNQARPGQIVAINDVRAIYKGCGAAMLQRIAAVGVRSGAAPITTTLTRALRMIFEAKHFADTAALGDERIAAALASIVDVESAAQRHAGMTGQNRYRACAALIADAAKALPGRAAA